MRSATLVLSALSIVLALLLVMTGLSYFTLKSDYAELENYNLKLKDRFLEIKSQYAELNSSFSLLTANYSNLKKDFTSLRERYTALNQSYHSLLENYTFVKSDYNRLQSDYQSLKREYDLLVKEREALEKDYEELRSRYENLTTGYESLETGYSDIKRNLDLISERILLPEDFFPEILNQSLQPEVSQIVVNELGLRSDMDPEFKAKEIMEWVVMNVQYLADDYHQFLNDSKLDVFRNFASLPNETLARGGGDCEDLAILTYAMLRFVLGGSERVYLIGIAAGERGHIAVLYKAENGFMIIDPATNYMTNGVVVFSLTVYKGDVPYSVWLTPMGMPPSHKQFLSKNELAEIMYLDPKNFPARASSYYEFWEPRPCVDAWLDYVSSTLPGASVRLVANESYVRSFISTQDFLEWVTSR